MPHTALGLSVYEDQPSSLIAYALASSEYASFIEQSAKAKVCVNTVPRVFFHHLGG